MCQWQGDTKAAHPPEIISCVTGASTGGLARVSRVENGITPYTQDVLETYARVLGCTVADLVSRPPSDPEGLWAIWDRLRAEDRRRAVVILRALVDSDENTFIAEQRL
jgi:hypothetical protein